MPEICVSLPLGGAAVLIRPQFPFKTLLCTTTCVCVHIARLIYASLGFVLIYIYGYIPLGFSRLAQNFHCEFLYILVFSHCGYEVYLSHPFHFFDSALPLIRT